MPLVVAIPVIIVAVIITAVVAWNVAISYRKKVVESKIGNRWGKAREIIDEAMKTAETKKREGLLEVKEEALKNKNELERESRERRAELQKYEKRVLGKEEALDRKADSLEKKESQLTSREDRLNKMKQEVEALNEQRVQELRESQVWPPNKQKNIFFKTVEDEVKHETAMLVKDLENRAKEEASKKAKDYVVTAIQKCAADHVAETTISVVPLPNDEMKGRIIGREGRNIRTLETMTGIDLIIDDTPEAVILSSFDPIRREVARIALESWSWTDVSIRQGSRDGWKGSEGSWDDDPWRRWSRYAWGWRTWYPSRACPASRQDEVPYKLWSKRIETFHRGSAAFRTLAAEIGVDVRMAKRAGLLHDIGKSEDHEMEGSHIQIGVDLCRKYKRVSDCFNAVEAHHGDVEPTSLIACIVQAADTISAARPGARRETLKHTLTD